MKKTLALLFLTSLSINAAATEQFLDNEKITFVAVNGGVDSSNPGTTCLRIKSDISAICAGGWVAIKNNNKELLSAALHAKATERDVWFYFEDSFGSNHCPGKVFTNCVVNSIGLK